jgi:hypothetical protein
MITAKNYAAQAEKYIVNNYSKVPKMAEEYSLIEKRFLNPIKNSVHFALPDTGVIFDDEYRGIRGEEVRLPFPSITLEYYFPYGDGKLEKDHVWSSKRLILATEYTSEQVALEYPEYDFDFGEPDMMWIAVYGASYIPEDNFWGVEPFGWLMPSAWDKQFVKKNGETVFSKRFQDSREGVGVNGYVLPLMKSILEKVYEQEGEIGIQSCVKDIGNETATILELCEALSCSNVHHRVIESIDPAVNQRRIKDGKVPMYETRTLWIDVPNFDNVSVEWQGGTHRSPRQHLRRGHIRNLQSGKKVWVNATVVGAKENGFIRKDYAIKELA